MDLKAVFFFPFSREWWKGKATHTLKVESSWQTLAVNRFIILFHSAKTLCYCWWGQRGLYFISVHIATKTSVSGSSINTHKTISDYWHPLMFLQYNSFICTSEEAQGHLETLTEHGPGIQVHQEAFPSRSASCFALVWWGLCSCTCLCNTYITIMTTSGTSQMLGSVFSE